MGCDLGHHRHAAAQRGHPALGAVQVQLGERRPDCELEQRCSPGHQVAQRGVAGAQPQVAGIHAVRRDRDEGLPGQVLLAAERLERRGPPRRVAVEDVDQFTAKEAVVHHESAQHRQMLVAEGGAAGGHRSGDPGQMHRHHVGVALDDHGLVALGDVAFGQIDAEHHVRLLVQQRLGRVDVLGFHRIVVEQPAGAEPDHLAGRAADGPQQPPVEPVHRATPALPRQAGRLQLLELKTLALQVFCQRIPARRCESAPEVTGRLGIEVAFGQILAGRRRLVGLERRRVELRRGRVGRDEPAAAAAVALHAGGRAGVGDRVADPVGEQFDGLDEADVLDLLEERVHVAALAAAEAVEVPVVGADVKRRRLLVVKRAQALERIRTGTPQLDVIADHFIDAHPFADGGDVAVGNPAPALARPSPWAREPAGLDIGSV